MEVATRFDLNANPEFVSPSNWPPRQDFWNPTEFQKTTTRLRVVRLQSPARFWLQNAKEEAELKQMEGQMTDWYDEYWEKSPALKPDDIQIGGSYVAYWEAYKQWSRVRVLKMIPGEAEEGTHYFIQSFDYGSVTVVPLDYLYPIRKIYNQLPIQAVQAQLFGLEKFSNVQAENFYKEFGGKEMDVIVVDERDRVGLTFPIISVIISTKRFEPGNSFEYIFSTFYTLNNQIKFENFMQRLIDYADGSNSSSA